MFSFCIYYSYGHTEALADLSVREIKMSPIIHACFADSQYQKEISKASYHWRSFLFSKTEEPTDFPIRHPAQCQSILALGRISPKVPLVFSYCQHFLELPKLILEGLVVEKIFLISFPKLATALVYLRVHVCAF